ncbi:MAG: nucleotide exchange factor GrpE [Lachnospiraceae bacterium]|nr:nucleotide exchange factor GrpE [Lachnospiraceae bacterium]
MTETEKKQDQEIDQNMADADGKPESANKSGESANAEADQADAQANAAQENASDTGMNDEAQDEGASTEENDENAADESSDTAAGESTASTAKEKKSFFSKKDKNKEKDKDKERIAELEDRVMRQMAEFENFRRRSEKEKQQMFETGARSVIEKILPVVDNFERGLSSIPEAERQGAVAEGMNMIYKQLQTELDNIGVKAIDAVGQEFDPAKHNAVMQVTSEEYESGIVAQELQKGYTYRDTVIRHSMVAVVE